MKNLTSVLRLSLLTAVVFAFGSASAQMFWNEDFEADNAGVTYTLSTTDGLQFSDGSADFFTQVPSGTVAANYVVTGQNNIGFFAAQDTDAEPTGALTLEMFFDDISIAGQSDLQLRILVAEDTAGDGAEDWDAGDELRIEVDIDNSGVFTTIMQFTNNGLASNGAPGLDADFNGVWDGVEGAALTDVFTEFVAGITGTGSVIDIRIVFQGMSNGDEDVAIDFVQLWNASPTAFDCPALLLNIGDSCDDGDAATINDVVTAACTCEGVPAIDGCTDLAACNYDPTANNDNGTCLFVGDACDDGDAATTGDVIQGDCSCAGTVPTFDCPAESANFGDPCNDGDANTVADAIQNDCTCAGIPVALDGCTLFFSEYGEGTSNNKYFEIYNPTDADISLDGYAYPNVSNAPTVVGEYEFWNTFAPGAIVPAGGVYIVAHGLANATILAVANETNNFLSNGDDGFALVQGTATSYVIVDWLGNWDGDPGSGWAVAGVANATVDAVLVRKSTINSGNNDWFASAGTDATDSEWIVLANEDWSDIGQHTFTGTCGPVTFDCPALSANIGDSCDDGDAATINDVVTAACTCEGVPAIDGCTDLAACNYDPTANNDNGTCLFVGDACDDGDANTTGDAIQGDCSCAGTVPMFDCPVIMANIGDPCDDGDAATTNDTVQADCSCAGTIPAPTCATEDFENIPAPSGSYTNHTWTGFDGGEWNATGARTDQTMPGSNRAMLLGNSSNGIRTITSPVYPGGIGTLSFDYVRGFTGTGDRSFRVFVNGVQIGTDVVVDNLSDAIVTYSQAIDFPGDVQLVIESVGTAQILFDNLTWTCFDGVGPVFGCTDLAACNYDATATFDDGSCLIVGDACDDGLANTINDVVTAACACEGTPVVVPNIVINEIHYNPCTQQGGDTTWEFVELYNAEATAVDLSGYFFTGIDFIFPAGSTIAAGEYIIVAVVPASYEGNGYQVFGPFGGALGNSGELVALSDANGVPVDQVTYAPSGDWPTDANGGCSSLEVIDALADNSVAANWQASYTVNGTPGAANSTAPVGTNYTIFEIQSDVDANGGSNLVGTAVITQGIVTGVYANGVFSMQDGTGPFSGIWVSASGVQIGDEVEVAGTVSENFDLTLIVAVSSLNIQSQGNPLPAPQSLFTADINQEQWEGVLLQVTADVTVDVNGFGEWALSDGSGDALVDDLGILFASVGVGVQYTVTGPNYYSFGDFKLEPRDANDVLRWGCTDNTFANFDPLAVIEDGSCSNAAGCTNPLADNYDPAAVVDDGSCFIQGCTDPTALNFNADATADNGSCYFTVPAIVINEIHYNPCVLQGNNIDSDFQYEFFELYNAEAFTVDLSGWVVSGSTQFVFPQGASIAAGEYIVLAIDAAFYTGNGYQVFQWTSGNLGNGGGNITLADAFANIVDVVGYADAAPWPITPDGGCVSLELIDTALDNADGSNWQASYVLYGTPGAQNTQNIVGCTNAAACNYDPAATSDDGSCDFTSCLGCTYAVAQNYNPTATVDDQSCIFEIGSTCPGDFNDDGVVNITDLSGFLGAFGTICQN